MHWQQCRVDGGAGFAADLQWLSPAHARGPGLYWLPAMGVAARHYRPLAECLAAAGITVALHEWRGIASSNVRAGRGCDWGYHELLRQDLAAGLDTVRVATGNRPWMLGGHSLGGQLAALGCVLQPAAGLVLVASGTPYWRRFPRGWRLGLRLAYALAPRLARWHGHFPGRRLGFAGREARGVVADWACSGGSGRYVASGLDLDLEAGLAALRLSVLGLQLADDRFGPAASLHGLLAKMPHTQIERRTLDAQTLGTRADHFAWMRRPQAVADEVAGWMARQHR